MCSRGVLGACLGVILAAGAPRPVQEPGAREPVKPSGFGACGLGIGRRCLGSRACSRWRGARNVIVDQQHLGSSYGSGCVCDCDLRFSLSLGAFRFFSSLMSWVSLVKAQQRAKNSSIALLAANQFLSDGCTGRKRLSELITKCPCAKTLALSVVGHKRYSLECKMPSNAAQLRLVMIH